MTGADDCIEFDPATVPPREIYFVQSALVVPRPIAWVSSLSAAGVLNLAPISYFNALGSEPPIVVLSLGEGLNTLANIRAREEFVVSFANPEFAPQVELTAVGFPPDESEFEWAGLDSAPSRKVAVPRVAGSTAALECRAFRVEPLGRRNHMVLAQVVNFVLHRSAWTGERVDATRHRPLGRVGSGYAEQAAPFRLTRPALDEAMAAGPAGALDLVRRRGF